MKKLLVFGFLIFAYPAFADNQDILRALIGYCPNGEITVGGAGAISYGNFPCEKPTQAQINAIIADYTSSINTIARRVKEIQTQAMSLYNQYALYASVQSVIDYGAALRAVSTTAATEMAALPDVASIKNYQPVWPPKPNL